MRRRTHGGERVEEGLKSPALLQAVEAFPDAVPASEPLRQRAPPYVFEREEMKCFEEAAIVFAFASATRKAGPKHRERMRLVFLVHPCRHGFSSPTQSEFYESCLIPPGNPQDILVRRQGGLTAFGHASLPGEGLRGAMPARRATKQRLMPGCNASSTRRTFSAALQRRRR